MDGKENKKDWVKNAIIIFLVIMLLLTFFSNTITNYTLPTVSTRMVSQGDITTGIRQSGNVEVGESYVMKADMTRKIESVAVAKDEHVNKGDVIFYLLDEESDELKKAEAELDTAELNYYKSLLASEMSADTAASVNANGLASFDSYIAQLDALETQINDAQQVVYDAQAEVDKATVESKVEVSRQAGSTDNAELEKTIAELCKSNAEGAFSATRSAALLEIDDILADYKSNLNTARESLNAVNTQLNSTYGISTNISNEQISSAAYVVLEDYKDYLFGMVSGNNQAITSKYSENPENYTSVDGLNALLYQADDDIDRYKSGYEGGDGYYSEEYYELIKLKEDLTAMTYKDDSSYQEALGRVRETTANLNAIKSKNARATANFDTLTTLNKAYLETAKTRLEQLKSDKKALTNDIAKALEADNFSKEIDRKQKEIDNLRSKYENGVVVAEVSGRLSAINVVAGETMEKGKDICTIIPDGKNYQVKLSVKAKEAEAINVGDPANFEDSWNYPDGVAIVKSIKDDPDNPGTSSIITCELSGSNIKVGKSVSLSIGLKSRSYDLVVPKSAYKKDSKGNFVWVLHSSESALGNKYTVERVEVKSVAEDDKNVAVRGGVSSGDTVVTTTTKEIQDGKRVRLSEGSN